MKTFYFYAALFISVGVLYAGQHYYFKHQEDRWQEEKNILCQTLKEKIQTQWGNIANNVEEECAFDKINEVNQKINLVIDAIERSEQEKSKVWLKEEDERLKRKFQELQEKEQRRKEFKMQYSHIIDYIKKWECGQNDYFCLKDEAGNFFAYECAANVMTIGWGHTATAHMKSKISFEEAEDLLISDIQNAMKQLKSLNIVINHLTLPQQAAIIGAMFNIGHGNFRSMKSVVEILRQGIKNKETLAYAWMKERPITVSRRPNRGLIKRKHEEIQLIIETSNYILI